jgi:hypothetical protein
VVRGWAAIHDLVILELDDQLDGTGLDVGELARTEADTLATDLGVTDEARNSPPPDRPGPAIG